MKNKLLALSLITSGGLIAEGQYDSEIVSSYCGTCCCTPCCCKPQPTECVSGVAYTAPFYDLQCDWGAFIDVEFLYWYAKETDLSYATVFTSVEKGPEDPADTFTVMAASSYKDVDSTWDPGFRVGLGWNSECDGWDVYLNYTWTRNRKTTSTSVPEYSAVPQEGEQGILNPWINSSFNDSSQNVGSGLFPQFFSKVSAKWRLQWNVIDLELGRKYWLSSCFNLRPYAAIRGAWWKTRFRTTSTKTTAPVNPESGFDGTFESKYVDRFTNRAWGVGLLGGLQPTWYFSCCFALYGNFDVALLWGEHEGKKRERYNIELFGNDTGTPANYSNQSKRKFDQMTAVLDAGIGLRWEESWCCDRYRTTLDLGWEHHVYFDQNHRVKSYDFFDAVSLTGGRNLGYTTNAFEHGNIGLGGFVLRARFDF